MFLILLQGGPPPWAIGNPPKFAPGACIQCIPIDDGVWTLVIIGLIIGLYDVYKKRKT